MRLYDVRNNEQLNSYYTENGLDTVQNKIVHLTAAMKIRATRCDEAESDEENLEGLEDTVFNGYWRGSYL